MRNINQFAFLLWCVSSLAIAQPAVKKIMMGEEAKTLVQAIKLANVVPQKSAQYIDYSVHKIICHTGNAYPDGLIVYDCKLNQGHKISGAPAKVLYEALVQLKIPVDAAMSQTRVTATQIFCRIQPEPAPVQYHCQLFFDS